MKAKRHLTKEHRQKIKEAVKRYYATETQEQRAKRVGNLIAFWEKVKIKLKSN